MSLESAIKIFTEQGFSDPQLAVDTIRKAGSLDTLSQIMLEDKTYLSADQFVSFRLKSLFEGDPEFEKETLALAKERFGNYGVPEEIVNYYVSKGGGVDIAITMMLKIDLGKFQQSDPNTNLEEFYDEANKFLFETLKSYVNDS